MNFLRIKFNAMLVLAIGLSSPALFAQTTSQAKKIVRLDGPLGTESEKALAKEGIKILHYYGDQTYLLSGQPTTVKHSPVQLAASRSQLARDISAESSAEIEVDLVLAYAKAERELQNVLAKAGFKKAKEQVSGGITLTGVVAENQLKSLLEHPLILNATPVLGEAVPYNLEARIGQSVTPLNSGIPGAPNLNGQGVVLGVGDGGKLSGHPDIGDRVISSTSYYNSAWRNHPDMVSGIMASTGSVYSENRGVACEAELVIEPTSGIVYNAPTHLANFQMSITNNSYGPSFNCTSANKYYGSSASVDQQLFDNPNLIHVYAVGNSGSSSCNGLPASYGTIPGGAQVAKNTLSVGNMRFNRTRFVGSSAGPTFDGRIKPEIVAIGHNVTSNNRQGGYSTGTGTSYAAPGVAATLGLLTQRYKELNGGVLPEGALLKAIACNTAEDLGPAGPDFQHGFGLINGVKALNALNNSTYHQGSLSFNGQYAQSISTSHTTEQLKVLLYWPDQAGPTANTGATLVNNFDLQVVAPNGDTIRPWVLDPINPANVAVRGIDTLNNIEQVTIPNPTQGTYQILVNGVHLPYGSTDYVLSWVVEEPEVMLTCPYGGESINPFEDMYIGWEASSGQAGTWKIEYNVDGGAWQTIQAGIANAVRNIVWSPPVENSNLSFRVTNESSLLSDETNSPTFALAAPATITGESFCDGGIALNWSPVNSATSYEVYKFDGSEMELVSTVSDTFINLQNLSAGVDSLFTVAAVSPSGKTSQRAFAVAQKSEVDGAGCLAPLPVEWVAVGAAQDGDYIKVSWTVAAELNNERFEVLRSDNGHDWSSIATVAGRGDAQTAKTYSFLDQDVRAGGITYYQIQQVDFDGQSDLSDIVAYEHVQQAGESSTSVTLIENPITSELRLQSTAANPLTVSLYDLSGKECGVFQLSSGENSYAWPSGLGAGMYLLEAKTNSGVESLKLVKR